MYLVWIYLWMIDLIFFPPTHTPPRSGRCSESDVVPPRTDAVSVVDAQLRRHVSSAGTPVWVAVADLYSRIGDADMLQVTRACHVARTPGMR